MNLLKIIALSFIASGVIAMEQSPSSPLPPIEPLFDLDQENEFYKDFGQDRISAAVVYEPEENQTTYQLNQDLDAIDYAVEFAQIEDQPEQSLMSEVGNNQESQTQINQSDANPNQDQSYQCPLSPEKIFYNSREFIGHVKTHPELQDKFYRCDNCLQHFTSKDSFRQHQRNKHPELLKYICNEKGCDKKFLTEQGLDQHKKMHSAKSNTQIKTFTCEICSKSYFTSLGLTEHQRNKHRELLKFICNICNKRFKTLPDRKTHYTKVHDNPNKDEGAYNNHYFDSILLNKAKPLTHDFTLEKTSDETLDTNFSSAALVTALQQNNQNLTIEENQSNKTESKKKVLYKKCNYCPQTFKTDQFLSHKKLMHKDKYIYPCEKGCNEIFDTSQARKSHYTRIHNSLAGDRKWDSESLDKANILIHNFTLEKTPSAPIASQQNKHNLNADQNDTTMDTQLAAKRQKTA